MNFLPSISIKFIVAFFCLFLISSLFSQKIPREALKLKGEVNSLRYRWYDIHAKGDSITKKEYYTYGMYNYKLDFDQDQNPIQLVVYDAFDTVKSRTLFEYNTFQQWTIRKNYIAGELESVDSLFYGDKISNQYHTLKSYKKGVKLDQIQFVFLNKYMQASKITLRDVSGKKLYKSKRKFDSNGNLLKIISWGDKPRKFLKLVLEYDEQDREILVKHYPKSYFLKGTKVLVRNEYNEQGDIELSTSFHNRPKYDVRSIYKYTYDTLGNWITKSNYTSEGDLNYFTEREIIYQ